MVHDPRPHQLLLQHVLLLETKVIDSSIRIAYLAAAASMRTSACTTLSVMLLALLKDFQDGFPLCDEMLPHGLSVTGTAQKFLAHLLKERERESERERDREKTESQRFNNIYQLDWPYCLLYCLLMSC